MSTAWVPIAVLPHVDLRLAIKGDIVALVPPTDSRVGQLGTEGGLGQTTPAARGTLRASR